MRVIIFGATGLVGGEVLRYCLNSEKIASITTIGRRPTGMQHAKLREVVHNDFTDYRAIEKILRDTDLCFYCVGVYQSLVSKEVYWQVTVDYLQALLVIIERLKPEMTFCLFSAEGADRSGRAPSLFARAKGRAEQLLVDSKIANHYMFRPGYIDAGSRRLDVPWYYIWIFRPAYKLLPFLGIEVQDLAKAMVEVGLQRGEKRTYSNGDMRKLVRLLLLLIAMLFVGNAYAVETSATNPLLPVSQFAPGVLTEMRYAGAHNFIGRPIKGYKKPICLLTKPAAQALAAVQREAEDFGLSLRVYDCYRPQKAVDDFVAWAKDLTDLKMQREFYPHVQKDKLFAEGYIAEKSGHSRGSTLDLTLDNLDMGSPYDYFDPVSHTANPNLTPKQRQNRLLLKSLMEKYGFVNLKEEWWHFTLKDEPFKDKYFDFDVE